jgi:hypothetical protein
MNTKAKCVLGCSAIVEDMANASRYNLVRVMLVVPRRRCKYVATMQIGEHVFCTRHAQLALEGLISADGTVADRGVIRGVRKYPKKFLGGLYTWARGLKVEKL